MTDTHPLFRKTMLVVAADPELRKDIKIAFRPFDCVFLFRNDENSALEAMRGDLPVDMAFLYTEKNVSHTFEFVRILQTIGASVIPIFIVCDRVAPDFDDAYFEGVDAIFVKPVTSEYLEKGVSISFVEVLENDGRTHQRKRICRARVSYESFGRQSLGYATNISLGGMFVGTISELPARGQEIKFTISSSHLLTDGFSGSALVKWHRPELKYGKPRGFGVEFLNLDSETKQKLEQILANGQVEWPT